MCDIIEDVWGLHDDSTRLTIKRFLQVRYYELCAMAGFQELRNSKSLTFLTTDTNGQWLPSDLIGVVAVLSSDGETRYVQTSEDRQYLCDGRYHWFHPSVQQDTLAEGAQGMTVLPNQSTANCASAAAGWTGYQVKFIGWPGFYTIGTVTPGVSFVFTPSFKGGQAITDGRYEVRPKGTKKIVLVDDEGAVHADTAKVFYWQYPEPLFDDAQSILLPNVRALENFVKADCIGSVEKRKTEADGYLNEAKESLSALTMLAPTQLQPAIPRNRSGNTFMFGRRR
jgi:hypothetical protein